MSRSFCAGSNAIQNFTTYFEWQYAMKTIENVPLVPLSYPHTLSVPISLASYPSYTNRTTLVPFCTLISLFPCHTLLLPFIPLSYPKYPSEVSPAGMLPSPLSLQGAISTYPSQLTPSQGCLIRLPLPGPLNGALGTYLSLLMAPQRCLTRFPSPLSLQSATHTYP